MERNSNSSGGIGFTTLLQIAFIVLKLTKVITWKWVWVLAPTWIVALIVCILILIIHLSNKGKGLW